jgi:ATP-dependent RNA helicase DeaD
MEMPSTEQINNRRIEQFKQSITDTLASEDLSLFSKLVEQYRQEHGVPAENIAAALARLAQGNDPLLLQPMPEPVREYRDPGQGDSKRGGKRERERDDYRSEKRSEPRHKDKPVAEDMERFRLEVGHKDQVKPGNIVGAISNEAGIDSKYIGLINIYDDYSTVDLPRGMPEETFKLLQGTWVSGQMLKISREGQASSGRPPLANKGKGRKKPEGKKFKGKQKHRD